MATKAKPYTCIHCGEPCGVTGHLVRIAEDLFGASAWFCPVSGLFRLTWNGELRFGFRCPPGHTCFTQHVMQQQSTMTAPRNKVKERALRPPTVKQMEFLDSLGYTGPAPVTIGQARQLLDHIIKGEEPPDLNENIDRLVAGHRNVHVRPEDLE